MVKNLLQTESERNIFRTLQISQYLILEGAVHVSFSSVRSDHQPYNLNFILANFIWHTFNENETVTQ